MRRVLLLLALLAVLYVAGVIYVAAYDLLRSWGIPGGAAVPLLIVALLLAACRLGAYLRGHAVTPRNPYDPTDVAE